MKKNRTNYVIDPIFNNQNQLKTHKIHLQVILVLSEYKIVDSIYKLMILKIHHTAVMFDRVLSVRYEACIRCYNKNISIPTF